VPQCGDGALGTVDSEELGSDCSGGTGIRELVATRGAGVLEKGNDSDSAGHDVSVLLSVVEVEVPTVAVAGA